jgi:ATP-binding cassette, subfamily C, bacterial CydC
VLELTDREPAVSDPPNPIEPPDVPATLALESVTARYRHVEEPALSEVDLRLDPGGRVALAGPSGAGKTTVTNLLLRFLDPEEGRVTIDGRDLRDYRQEDVRRTFALAGQEAHLFNSSIRANLLLARPEATDAELEEALDMARIGAWVRSTPWWARRGCGFPAASGSASSSLAPCLPMPPYSSSTSRRRTWITTLPRS